MPTSNIVAGSPRRNRVRNSNTFSDEELNEFACLAAQLCDTPAGGITLAGRSGEWMEEGVPPALAAAADDLPDPDAALELDALREVSDERGVLRGRPYSLAEAGPGRRFYAELPLVANDTRVVGRLWVVDYAPRRLSDRQRETLQVLRRQVMRRFEPRSLVPENLAANPRRIGINVPEQPGRGETREHPQPEESTALHAILENLAEAVVACDATGTLSLFNRSARDWHGIDGTGCPGPWATQFDLREADGVTRLAAEDVPLSRALRGESVRGAEITIGRKGNPTRVVVCNGDPLRDSEGRISGAVIVMHDVTEIRSTEKQRLRTQRLESIGTLAGGISHDLNNALAPILMISQILRKKFPDAGRLIDTLETSANRGSDMVKQLLTFAKGAEGERCLLDPQAIIEEISTMCRRTFPKGVRIQTRVSERFHRVLGDSTQLHQILLNLCVNARDAMPKGGTLTLQAENVRIDQQFAAAHADAEPGLYVAWSVTDTGTGISPEVMERIFEPFFSTKGPDSGTGLGLSTLLGIVRSHGGFIDVQSTLGKGSTFAVFLPFAGEASGLTSHPIPLGSPFRGQGETVLLVDDEGREREALGAMLEELGFRVIKASDRDGTLQQIATCGHRIRIVMISPAPSLADLVHTVAEELDGAAILITGRDWTDAQRTELRAHGADAFVSHPLSQSSLMRSLEDILA